MTFSIETEGKKTIATKNIGNLCKLKVVRCPEGVELNFEGEMVLEYMKTRLNTEAGKVPLARWKTKERKPIEAFSFLSGALPAGLSDMVLTGKLDRELMVNGRANISWFGCTEFPVVIPGVYTQAMIDQYCKIVSGFMRALYLEVLKPYGRTVTLTYETTTNQGGA